MRVTTADQPDFGGQVIAALARHFNVQRDQITASTTIQDLGADSLDVVEARIRIEELLAIELPDVQAETVGDLITAVNEAMTRQKA